MKKPTQPNPTSSCEAMANETDGAEEGGRGNETLRELSEETLKAIINGVTRKLQEVGERIRQDRQLERRAQSV